MISYIMELFSFLAYRFGQLFDHHGQCFGQSGQLRSNLIIGSWDKYSFIVIYKISGSLIKVEASYYKSYDILSQVY